MNRLCALLYSVSALGLVLAFSSTGRAATPCVTDSDCPDPTCGGQVCQWLSTTDHECQAAGSRSRGSDGWCNMSTDCKCQSVGALCNAESSCSFVLAKDAPAGGGAGGSAAAGAGGSATGGAGAGTGGASGGAPDGGASIAGSDGTLNVDTGTTTTGGSGQTASDGPISGMPSGDGGGCQLSVAHGAASERFGLGVLASALLLRLRRQRDREAPRSPFNRRVFRSARDSAGRVTR